MAVTLHEFDHADRLIAALSASIVSQLDDALRLRGAASMALCGGSTPAALYAALAPQPLDWSRVTLTLTDERWVPPSDAASNHGLLNRTLFSQPGLAHAARFLPLYTGAATPEDGVAACARSLAALPATFDLVLLGMGNDGHTASLFPDSSGLAEGLSGAVDCVAVRAGGDAVPRISLSLKRLLAARRLCLLITGAEKRRVLEHALVGNNREAMPIRAALHQATVPVDIYWTL